MPDVALGRVGPAQQTTLAYSVLGTASAMPGDRHRPVAAEQAAEAYELLDHPPVDVLQVILDFRPDSPPADRGPASRR